VICGQICPKNYKRKIAGGTVLTAPRTLVTVVISVSRTQVTRQERPGDAPDGGTFQTLTPVRNFGLQLRFIRVWRAPFVSVRQTRRKWSWSPRFRTGEPNFTVPPFPASFLRVWRTRRNEARWTRRNEAGKFKTVKLSSPVKARPVCPLKKLLIRSQWYKDAENFFFILRNYLTRNKFSFQCACRWLCRFARVGR
jgi:hypothetical protein